MALPTHRIEIHKHVGAEKWVNTYLVNAATMDAAEGFAAGLISFERSLHLSAVVFDYARTSTTIVGDRTFDHIVVNLPGLGDPGTSVVLPLFNTLRLDLQVNDADPARKYYRGCLTAAQLESNFTIIDSAVTYFQGVIDAHAGRPSLQGVVTPKGNIVLNQVVADKVQERQLHRRRKKKIPTATV